MRDRRPYLYSDSTVTNAYELSASEFSHILGTLTDRNQHKDFENFARKLCEREICPNLRPQTGPEGGGDGKVDADSYPVSNEVSDRWLIGDANAGSEKWGFAVSATKKWSVKVRDDVDGMIETGRVYHRIFFVTSRPARSKDRLRIEQELLEQHNVPVTILDREWIIDKTVENRHEDLAHDLLGAGRHDPDRLQLGPNDIRRQHELEKLEKTLGTNASTQRELNKAIVSAFDAACLSRELEVPRYLTEGRFQRAIRLAEKHGDANQVLRAHYEHAWTMLWWFDDISTINDEYETIEKLAFESGLAEDASRVCNLFQVLMARCKQGWETATELCVEDRGKRLGAHLDAIARNKSLPNNALHGAALVQLHRLALVTSETEASQLDSIWKTLIEIVKKADGMGEFPATMLDGVVEMLSPFVSESPAFDELLERLAEFMGARHRDGKAGEIYLNRGRQKVENDEAIEAIAWLGKASHCFMKEEYREEQFEALLMLSAAYRGVGLLWAGRATCLAALVQIKALSADAGEQRPELIPSVLLFVRTCLELGRIPDFLFGILWLRSLQENVDLTNQGDNHLADEFQNLDQLFACLLAASPQASVARMSRIPDVLDRLGLHVARLILLYRLGHVEFLLEEGSLPNEEALEEIEQMANMLAAQPAASSLPKHAMGFGDPPQALATTVLGAEVAAKANTDQEILIAETQLAAIEAFSATAIRCGTMPIASYLDLETTTVSDLRKPEVDFEAERMQVTTTWPEGLRIEDIDRRGDVSDFLIEFCVTAFSATTTLAGKYDSFLDMLENELVLNRAISFANAAHTHHRVFGKYAFTLQDLDFLVGRAFDEKDPPSEPIGSGFVVHGERNRSKLEPNPREPERHDSFKVHSVINTHLWNEAEWMGIVYASYGESVPPVMAFGFKNGEKGKAIFREWRREFGQRDESGDVRISILLGIDKKKPLAYRAHVTRSRDAIGNNADDGQWFWQLSRMQTMYPTNREHLDGFLEDCERIGCYFVAPAEMTPDGETVIHSDLALLKRDLNIKDAWSVGPDDDAMMALRDDDEIIVPADVSNPPCDEVMKLRRNLRKDA